MLAVCQVNGPFDTWATHASLVHNVTDTDRWTQNGNTHGLAMARTRILVKNQLGVVVNSFVLFLSTGREASSVRFPLKYHSFFGCAPFEILWLLR